MGNGRFLWHGRLGGNGRVGKQIGNTSIVPLDTEQIAVLRGLETAVNGLRL